MWTPWPCSFCWNIAEEKLERLKADNWLNSPIQCNVQCVKSSRKEICNIGRCWIPIPSWTSTPKPYSLVTTTQMFSCRSFWGGKFLTSLSWISDAGGLWQGMGNLVWIGTSHHGTCEPLLGFRFIFLREFVKKKRFSHFINLFMLCQIPAYRKS